MSSESEIKTEDVGRHDAYQTISWTYRFTKEEMIKRIDEKDAWYEVFDYVEHPAIDYDNMDDEECMALKMSAIKEEVAKLTAQQLLNHMIADDYREWILGIDYSLDAATDGSSIKTNF